MELSDKGNVCYNTEGGLHGMDFEKLRSLVSLETYGMGPGGKLSSLKDFGFDPL